MFSPRIKSLLIWMILVFFFSLVSSVSDFLRVIFCVLRRSQKPQYLPPEIWEKIFQKMTVKSLVKCICVCRVWKSIITNQAFILSHSRAKANNKDENHSIFHKYQSLSLPNYGSIGEAFPFKRKEIYLSDDEEVNCLAVKTTVTKNRHTSNNLNVVGTCNGLVCFVSESYSFGLDLVIIMNLHIQKYIVLPQPDYLNSELPVDFIFWCDIFLGFGFDSRNNDFKVVMLAQRRWPERGLYPPRVEVYSLVTGKWRTINHETSSICCINWMSKSRLLFVNGALHWMFCEGHCKHGNFISTFDLAEETIGKIELPNFWDESSCYGERLLVRGSCLALAYRNKGTYNVCVMKEYGVVDSWDLVFSFRSTGRVWDLMISQKVVVQNCGRRITIFDYDTDMEIVRDVEFQEYWIPFAQDCVESLFLINHNAYGYYGHTCYKQGKIEVHFDVSPI